MLKGLTVGCIVHFVLRDTDLHESQRGKGHEGAHVAAIVVNNWPSLGRDDGYANLTLFPDWSNDGFQVYNAARPQPLGISWVTSVTYSEEKTPGSWHWPERDNEPISEPAANDPLGETAAVQILGRR